VWQLVCSDPKDGRDGASTSSHRVPNIEFRIASHRCCNSETLLHTPKMISTLLPFVAICNSWLQSSQSLCTQIDIALFTLALLYALFLSIYGASFFTAHVDQGTCAEQRFGNCSTRLTTTPSSLYLPPLLIETRNLVHSRRIHHHVSPTISAICMACAAVEMDILIVEDSAQCTTHRFQPTLTFTCLLQ
jgi:hypothetical protein